MSRSVRPSYRRSIPTLVLVALPLVLVAVAIGFARSRQQASAAMPPPEPAAVPHFVSVPCRSPGETVTLMSFAEYAAQLQAPTR